MTTGGTFTLAGSIDYRIEIDKGIIPPEDPPNTFRWSDDGGFTWNEENVAMDAGVPYALNNGITIIFDAEQGHAVGDFWDFTATPFSGNLQEWQDVSGNNQTVVNSAGEIEAGVDVHVLADNVNVYWGAEDDWAAYYDGTDMNFSGTGSLIVSGTNGLHVSNYMSAGNDHVPTSAEIIGVRNDTGNASQKGGAFELDTTNAGGTYSQDAVFGSVRLYGAGALSDVTAFRGVITARANASQTVTNARIFEAQPNFGADGHDGNVTVFANFYGGAIGTFTGDGVIATAYGLYLDDVTGGSTNYAIYTNDGLVRFGDEVEAGGSTTKIKLTSLGGYAIKLTNKTGNNSVAGQIVKASTTTDDAFALVGVNGTNPIAIILETGVSDGSEAWIVKSGIANVLVDTGGCVRGDRLITGAIGGFATVNNAPAVAVHFQEIGHCIETRTGAGLARCVLHFN